MPAQPLPPKRHWIAFVAVAILATSLAGLWWWLRPTRRGAFILVSIDTLRADHLAVYGYTKGHTPALDAFAKDGAVFDHAYSHTPQTLPAHASILTGRLPFEQGVRDNIDFTLKPGTLTLPVLFKKSGYRTGGFVSAYVLRPSTGIGQGFDVFNADMPAGSQERPLAQVQRPGLETLAAATTWMDTLVNDRFLLFLHVYEPHKPYTPPARYSALAPYDGEIAMADEIVGKFFDDLKRRDWYENAAIVVVADHGEGLGDHGEEEHGLFAYDSTIHVPLIIKLPGNRNAGRRIDDPVQQIDLLPTLTTLAGIRIPADLRGRSLLPAITGGHIAPQGIYSEALYGRYHFGWSEIFALTDDHYRYIKAPRAELYDIARDPKELTNILGDRAQVAVAMRTGLDALVASRVVDSPTTPSTEDRERLAALGYVSTHSAVATDPGISRPDPKDKVVVLGLFRQALLAIGERRYPEAAAKLRQVLAQDPNMTDAWSRYATVLVWLGRPTEALAAYREVIERRPDDASALLDAAAVLLTLNRYDEARSHAELAIASVPAQAHQLLAKIALASRDPAEALREAELAEQADPTLPMTDFVLGVIAWNKGLYADALPPFMRARERVAGRTVQINDLCYYIADSLGRLDRLDEAERFFREEMTLFPANCRARAGLAMLYGASGRSADAERVINAMLETIPTPEAYASAAEVWRGMGSPERSAAVLAESRARFGK